MPQRDRTDYMIFFHITSGHELTQITPVLPNRQKKIHDESSCNQTSDGWLPYVAVLRLIKKAASIVAHQYFISVLY